MAEYRYRLYQMVKAYLFCCQLLCSAPYPVGSLQRNENVLQPKSYFKQARFLMTTCVLSYVIICCLKAMVDLIDVPMPFFTGALYLNEVVLCVVLSALTVLRSYNRAKHYDRFVENILTVASSLRQFEWKDILSNVQCRMRWICTGMAVVFALCLVCDFVHFRTLNATLFSLGTYLLPNILVTLSILQCCFGMLLISKLLERLNRNLRTEGFTLCEPMQCVARTEQHYLRLTSGMELITRSYEVLIICNTFAGINVTSLQLLEIYQHMQVSDTHGVYIAYCFLWIVTQLCMLLLIIYPCHLVKREQTRMGLAMFELSQNTDEQTEVQIARFGILTLSRKDKVYTACGIFKLELSSLSKIFVALLSFMIILIQFDKTSLSKHQGAVTAMDSLYQSQE